MEYYGVIFALTTLFIVSTLSNAKTDFASPAPVPSPEFVNLEHLLSVAGPFKTFLNYLESTDVLKTFQNQANDTQQGITIFVPKDDAFAKLKKPSLSNLTGDQLRSLCLFHALPHYYKLGDFDDLSHLGSVSTFAGGELFGLKFSDQTGTAALNSGWSNARITSAVHASFPVAVYEVDKVLLPEAIFGTDIPPVPAPAPAPTPEIAPSPAAGKKKAPKKAATNSTDSSASYRISTFGFPAMIAGGFALLVLS